MSAKEPSAPVQEASSNTIPQSLTPRTSPELDFDRHNFKRYPNSKVTLDSLKQIQRLSYPQTHHHDHQLIERDLSRKLPKITQNDVTRYNLMNNIRLPYQNNDLPLHGPYDDGFSNEVSNAEEARRVQKIKNNYRVINVGGGPEATQNFKTLGFSRFQDQPYEFESAEAIDPMNRKYFVKMPKIMDYNKVDYLDKQRYQRPMMPYEMDPRGLRLVYEHPRETRKMRRSRSRKKKNRTKAENRFEKNKRKPSKPRKKRFRSKPRAKPKR